MPEVFLKALNLARNLGRKVDRLHRRRHGFHPPISPAHERGRAPDRSGGGRGIVLTGHHELMFPLLAAAIREELARRSLHAGGRDGVQARAPPDRDSHRLRLSRPLRRRDEGRDRLDRAGRRRDRHHARRYRRNRSRRARSLLRESWRYFPPQNDLSRRWSIPASARRGCRSRSKPRRARDSSVRTTASCGLPSSGPDSAARSSCARRAIGSRTSAPTFHGRDIFAPAAAWLWRGARLTRFGPALEQVEPLGTRTGRIRRGRALRVGQSTSTTSATW